jgi:hypothetical protein
VLGVGSRHSADPRVSQDDSRAVAGFERLLLSATIDSTMATWRRIALESFPHLRGLIQDPEVYTFMFFSMLVDEAWKAHDVDNRDLLRRIYGYAEWALNHPAEELWNPAGVSFYEHLFLHRKDRADWEKALHYITLDAIHIVWSLWEWFLTSDETKDIILILEKLGKPFTPPSGKEPACRE